MPSLTETRRAQGAMRMFLVFGIIIILVIIAIFIFYGRVNSEGTNIISQTLGSLTNWG